MDSLKEVTALNQKVNELHKAGRDEEAILYSKKALELSEKILGKNDPIVATALSDLATLYGTTGRYAEAESLHKSALEIFEKVFGKDHLDVAMSLNNLGHLYQASGRYVEAEPLHKRSLEICEKALGQNHPNVAINLNNLAHLYKTTGGYLEAESSYMRALEIFEKSFGKDHSIVAIGLNNLAALYETAGRYAEAEPLQKRSLEISEKVLGKDHPDVAMNLNNLAALYDATGRYAEAEPLYRRSLEITEKLFGNDHPNVAIRLNNLAWLYRTTGRYAEAEPLYKRSLEIREKVLGRDHPDIAISLNNLAAFYDVTGRYAEAEPLYKRSLEITERVLGKDHLNVAIGLNNLATLYEATDRHAEAEKLHKRSLEIKERVLDKTHPDVAMSLNNLAVLYQTTGRYGEAEPLYKRSLEIREKALGKGHPDVATSLNNIAILFQTTGKQLESHEIRIRGIKIRDKVRENIFLLLSDRQKLNYMEQNKSIINVFINHTAEYLQTNQHAVTNTFDAWLRWKGAVMEAQGRYIDAFTHSEDPEVRKKFEGLTHIRRELARLQLSGPGKMDIEEYKKRLETLESKKESLEGELSRLSKDFSLEKIMGRADAKTISEVLLKKETDSLYFDFAYISSYDFKENKFGEPRYLAFILLPAQEPVIKLIELPDTEGLEDHIRVYLREMNRAKMIGELPRREVLKVEAKAIYELLIKPIESYIKGKKHLYISPDGQLNLIPFEILMSPEGQYLMEDYLITYIAAGRDILRFMDTATAQGEALILADPDYDMGLEEKDRVAKGMGVVETRNARVVSRDAAGLRFDRLPDTKIEADVIEEVLRRDPKIKVRNCQGKQALEEVLLSVKEPKILHLSTHGYFLNDEEIKNPLRMGSKSQEIDKMIDVGIENPMLRSGIVLAGVNVSLREGRDDGMVSADKILGLRLKGTELVVLSACETGVGDVKSGEGVFGLKRSFILSGAKTVVMSLWSVPSRETAELMTLFYMLISEGKSKAEALREAKLKLMEKNPNPFYWGAFVMVGNPN